MQVSEYTSLIFSANEHGLLADFVASSPSGLPALRVACWLVR